MKSVEETTLLTKLEELVQMGKKKKSVLEYKEIMDHLADLDLDPDRIDKIYEYLETQGIDVLGNIEAEEEVEKELDLTLPEGINIDDPVKVYLKEPTELFACEVCGVLFHNESCFHLRRVDYIDQNGKSVS